MLTECNQGKFIVGEISYLYVTNMNTKIIDFIYVNYCFKTINPIKKNEWQLVKYAKSMVPIRYF